MQISFENMQLIHVNENFLACVLIKCYTSAYLHTGVIYSMFHITWTTLKFSRNQLGTGFSVCDVTLANCPSYVHTYVIIKYRNLMP